MKQPLDLKTRLRLHPSPLHGYPMCEEAANRIDELEAQLQEVSGYVHDRYERIAELEQSNAQLREQNDSLDKKCAELEAKLQKQTEDYRYVFAEHDSALECIREMEAAMFTIEEVRLILEDTDFTYWNCVTQEMVDKLKAQARLREVRKV